MNFTKINLWGVLFIVLFNLIMSSGYDERTYHLLQLFVVLYLLDRNTYD